MGRDPNSMVSVESDNGLYTAEYLPYGSGWMAGAIEGNVFNDDNERRAMAVQIMSSIEAVENAEKAFSTCTDGRNRLELADGTQVPVREQLVGTDTVSAFVAAEALGERFYGSDLYAPVDRRIARVVDFLQSKGVQPTAHTGCGAAGGFLTVVNRSTQFIGEPDYVNRLNALLPAGVYDPTMHNLIVGSYQSRIDSGLYEGYRDGLITDIVLDKGGEHAVEHYENDGQGINGHREQVIVYLDSDMHGVAVDPSRLQHDHEGLQVFGVNAGRADAIAQLFGDPNDPEDMNYRTARLAIEDFAAAGHGTLASKMETLVVSRVAA